MVCCVKEKYGGETAIFTCGDDPGDYCAQKSCEGAKYNTYTIEIMGCTFSKLPYNVFDSYEWKHIFTLNISNIGLESIGPDYFRSNYLFKLYASDNKSIWFDWSYWKDQFEIYTEIKFIQQRMQMNLRAWRHC